MPKPEPNLETNQVFVKTQKSYLLLLGLMKICFQVIYSRTPLHIYFRDAI